jgi:hypothetical protein
MSRKKAQATISDEFAAARDEINVSMTSGFRDCSSRWWKFVAILAPQNVVSCLGSRELPAGTMSCMLRSLHILASTPIWRSCGAKFPARCASLLVGRETSVWYDWSTQYYRLHLSLVDAMFPLLA